MSKHEFGPEDEDEVDDDDTPEDEIEDGWEPADDDEYYDADDFPQTDEEWEEACRDPDEE